MSTLASVFGYGLVSARPAAAVAGRFYYATDTTLMYRDNGSTWDTLAVGTGSMATDGLWDAAGDLAVGTGANTAAKLTLGAAGGALSRVNGAVAWNSGTSNPTAATGDRYWRTDLGFEIYYDGTRWLTVNEYAVFGGHSDGITGSTTGSNLPIRNGYDIYVTTVDASVFINGTNDGSNYWTLTFNKTSTANADTSLGNVTTAASAASTYVHRAITVNAVVVSATYPRMAGTWTKTSAPAALYGGFTVYYRLVVT